MCKKLKLDMAVKPKPKAANSSSSKPRFSDDHDIVSTPNKNLSGIFTSQFFKATTSSGNFHARLRETVLPDNPIVYRLKEIREATGHFSTGRIGKSSVWKSNLRGRIVAITVRRVKNIRDFRSGLRQVCNAHHANIIKLLGGCYEGENMYLVYEYAQGASLENCLRNSRIPGYAVLSTWISRIQIATDVAQALEYMHYYTNIYYVHNYLTSSSIIVTEPAYRARICHVGVSYLAGEYDFGDTHEDFDSWKDKATPGEITEEEERGGPEAMKLFRRTRSVKIRGTQGYMSPDYISTGTVSQKNDVFAFGVILLELLSGHEPVKYVTKANRQIERVSLIESVNRIISDHGGGEFRGRLRSWIDPKLKDSYPVDCAEKVARLAASCVDSDPHKRPDMRHVAGKLSKNFIRCQEWHEKMQANRELITVTFEAR